MHTFFLSSNPAAHLLARRPQLHVQGPELRVRMCGQCERSGVFSTVVCWHLVVCGVGSQA